MVAYELAYGHRPYIGRSKHEVKQLILTQQAHIDYDELPNGYHDPAADFINKLIQRKPKNRLGKDGISELINHPWLEGFEWEELKSKRMKAYYIPKEGDNFDKKYCLQNNKMGTTTIERYKEITLEPNYNKIFRKFDCDKVPDELKFIEPKIKYGETTNNGNNICNSSNNSTASISRNNKIKVYNNNNNVKAANNNFMVNNQRNNSMGNTLINRNQIIHENNNNKQMTKQIPAMNIIVKEQNEIFEKEQNSKDEENNLKFTHELKFDIDKKKEQKINFTKNPENSIMINKKNFSTVNEKKKIFRLLGDGEVPKNHNIHNSIGNINYNRKNNIQTKSIKSQNKSAIFDSVFDMSSIEKRDTNEKDKDNDNDKDSILINQKITNLNQYIMNNKNKKLVKTKMMGSSNSYLNLFPNEMFNNFKGNYFKKMIRSKILNKDIARLKNTNNSLIASNSTQSLFKKNNAELSSSYLKPTKKHFLNNNMFNGTFYPNKSSSTKYFFFPSKASASTMNKKIEVSNKRLSSSSSFRTLKKIKNNAVNSISSILPGSVNEPNYNQNISKDLIKNYDKNLPLINISLNKKSFQNLRNNFSFMNKSYKKYFLNANGHLSERIRENEIKNIKGSLND